MRCRTAETHTGMRCALCTCSGGVARGHRRASGYSSVAGLKRTAASPACCTPTVDDAARVEVSEAPGSLQQQLHHQHLPQPGKGKAACDPAGVGARARPPCCLLPRQPHAHLCSRWASAEPACMLPLTPHPRLLRMTSAGPLRPTRSLSPEAGSSMTGSVMMSSRDESHSSCTSGRGSLTAVSPCWLTFLHWSGVIRACFRLHMVVHKSTGPALTQTQCQNRQVRGPSNMAATRLLRMSEHHCQPTEHARARLACTLGTLDSARMKGACACRCVLYEHSYAAACACLACIRRLHPWHIKPGEYILSVEAKHNTHATCAAGAPRLWRLMLRAPQPVLPPG